MVIESVSFMCFIVDQTVVSVGPYILKTGKSNPFTSFHSVSGSSSPPTKRVFRFLIASLKRSFSISIFNRVGVLCITSTSFFSIRAASFSPSLLSSSFDTITVNPFVKGANVSRPKMSKESVVKHRMLS